MNINTVALTDEDNAALYRRIHGGDKAAINLMIEGNLPGLLRIVGDFIRRYPRYRHLKEDLFGEATLALTKTVNSFTEVVLEKHPSGRIVFEIDKALGSYVDQEIGSGMMSDRSVRRNRTESEPLPHRLPMDITDPPKSLWHHADGRVVRKNIDSEDSATNISNSDPVSAGPADVIGRKEQISRGDARQIVASHSQSDGSEASELLDLILACCPTEEDEMIVNLRMRGYTDAEIGEQMNLSHVTVWKRRQRIEERFEERRLELLNS